MDSIIPSIIEAMRAHLPPVFLGSLIDELTGGACLSWRTLQNKRSRREIPEDCFIYAGRQVLVRRDSFLQWWATTLSTSRPVIIGGNPTVSCKSIAPADEYATQKPKPRSRRSTAKLTKSSVGSPTCAAGHASTSMEQE